jgi:hypothetical protein
MAGLRAKAEILRRAISSDLGSGPKCPEDADSIERLAWSLCSDLLGLTSPVQQAIAEMAEGRA